MDLISTKEKKRSQLNADINRTYFWRKVLIIVNILLLVAFIIMIFIGDLYFGGLWQEGTEPFKKLSSLSQFGVGMLIWAIILVLLSGTVIALTIMIRSPRRVTEEVIELEHKSRRRR